MLDIDHFKSVNDRYGHAVGDAAIRAVAAACLDGKRKSDLVGRLGGEEFAVLLPETSLSRARTVAERIRKHVMGTQVFADNVQFGLTVSIGIAEATVGMSGIDALDGRGRSCALPGQGRRPQSLHRLLAPAACKQGGGVSEGCRFYSGTGTSNVLSVTETMQ